MFMLQHRDQQLQQLLGQCKQLSLTLTLPHAEVQTFNGDPVNYCNFIRSFENLIEAKTKSSSTKLYYLVQYTSGDVQELKQSCLSMQPDEGYQEACRLVKEWYGQSYKIASTYVTRVTNGPLSMKTAKHFRSFSSFSQAVRTPYAESYRKASLFAEAKVVRCCWWYYEQQAQRNYVWGHRKLCWVKGESLQPPGIRSHQHWTQKPRKDFQWPQTLAQWQFCDSGVISENNENCCDITKAVPKCHLCKEDHWLTCVAIQEAVHGTETNVRVQTRTLRELLPTWP